MIILFLHVHCFLTVVLRRLPRLLFSYTNALMLQLSACIASGASVALVPEQPTASALATLSQRYMAQPVVCYIVSVRSRDNQCVFASSLEHDHMSGHSAKHPKTGSVFTLCQYTNAFGDRLWVGTLVSSACLFVPEFRDCKVLSDTAVT